ncbi:MAG: hypothetical protein PVG65_05980 [Candidatus Thorarchaeota archaeon]|jgi:hypothetical protein
MVQFVRFILGVFLIMSIHGWPSIQQASPITVRESEILTTWDYEMQSWWSPYYYDDQLWLVYGEWNFGDQQILKVKTYDGSWSTPQLLASNGELIGLFKSSDGLEFFWIETTREESALIETLCQRTFHGEWYPPTCFEMEFNVGNHFLLETAEEKTLVWSRSGSWEYQIHEGGKWGEKQTLYTPEGYRKLLDVAHHEDVLWVFFETGTSDISYRVFDTDMIMESVPFISDGFPYIYSIVSYGNSLMVFLEVQESDSSSKTLAVTVYDGEWSPLQTVAGPEDGYLSGGTPLITRDGRLLIFWNGSESEQNAADLYYRMFDGTWSHIYRLTNTPGLWESRCTVTEYHDMFLILWREKESHHVYATTAQETDTEYEYIESLRQVSLKKEPPVSPPSSMHLGKYIAPLMVLLAIMAIAIIIILKKRTFSQLSKKGQ